jgi:pimeloyl-ACP methyl ester carboxylesterase
MPHGIEQYHDYVANADRLDIESHCRNSKVSSLIIHGEQDVSINISDGERIARWLNTDLRRIKDTQHTFDSSQPWEKDTMPDALNEVCQLALTFFKQN